MSEDMAPPVLLAHGLSKSFYGVHALHEVGFEVRAGEVLGVVGENGSGKSTTMNILAGVLQPDCGRMLLEGAPYAPRSRREASALGVAFIQQELGIFPNLTVAENLLLGHFPRIAAGLPFLSHRAMRARTCKLLNDVDLQISPGTPASRLSAGQRQLLEIARALAADARVIIFDEPTTSLTPREAERLFAIVQRLKARAVAVIYISHALDDVSRLSDHILVLRDGRVTLAGPNIGIATHDLVRAMVGRSIDALYPDHPVRTAAYSPLLEVEGVSEPGVAEDISFTIGSGEIVGLAGLMGSGRSELARILYGLDAYRRGRVSLKGRELTPGDIGAALAQGMAFLTEDRRHEGLMMEASVAENMALAALPIFTKGLTRHIAEKRLVEALRIVSRKLGIKTVDLRTTAVRTLSGGNQQKVVLGRWLLRAPSLLILDEPTRGVDIGAKEEIYKILIDIAARGVGILIISSELEELIGLSDRILVMRKGRLRGAFERSQFNSAEILKVAFDV